MYTLLSTHGDSAVLFKTRFILLLLLFSRITTSLSGQAFEPLEWGQVPYADRALQVYAPDSSAQAVVLGEEGYLHVSRATDGGFEWELNYHQRVKILQEAAINEYGNVEIYYYHHNGSDQLRQVKAQTVAPDGSITEVAEKEMFREKINEYWTKLTFGFSNVAVGSALEYRYLHFSERVLAPDEWVFRRAIPVRSSFFHFTNSAPISYSYLLRGAEYMPTTQLPGNVQQITQGDMSIRVDGTEFWMQNGAAVVEEPYLTTVADYQLKIRFQASEFFRLDGTSSSVHGSWEETNKKLLDDDHLGATFQKGRTFKNLLVASESVIDPTGTQEELLDQIQDSVTQQIKWSGRVGIYTDQSLDDAFSKHEADLPEVQYAGLALLRHYGIDANPVLLSTRDHGSMITEYPFLDQFNYVIILAQIDGRPVLVDLSSPLLKPGTIRMRALNGVGYLLHEDTPGWIMLDVPVFQDLLTCQGQIAADGSLTGTLKCVLRAYSASNDRALLEEKSLLDIWRGRLPAGSELTDLTAEHEKAVREDLIVNGQYHIPDAGFANEDFLYVSPLVYSNFRENPFVRETRSYPIDFPYPFEEKSIYRYDLPAGYQVDALPENKSMTLPNGDASFSYLAQEKLGKITIIMVLKVKATKYTPLQYEALRTLFETAAQKMQDQIVLKKIN